MKKRYLCLLLLALVLAGCGVRETGSVQSTGDSQVPEASGVIDTGENVTEEEQDTEDDPAVDSAETVEDIMKLSINDTEVTVAWEDNVSVNALRELVREDALTVSMSMYGGFEQVGSLRTSLPRNDMQTTTTAGDIVLYSGNQIVIFYGSNSWAYTRLGKITDKTAEEMTQLLGNGDVTVTIFAES